MGGGWRYTSPQAQHTFCHLCTWKECLADLSILYVLFHIWKYTFTRKNLDEKFSDEAKSIWWLVHAKPLCCRHSRTYNIQSYNLTLLLNSSKQKWVCKRQCNSGDGAHNAISNAKCWLIYTCIQKAQTCTVLLSPTWESAWICHSDKVPFPTWDEVEHTHQQHHLKYQQITWIPEG